MRNTPMKKNVKKAVCVIMSLAIGFTSAVAIGPAKEAEAKKQYKVVLDAGHDENHPGTRYDGLEEENITYTIVDYCKEYLEDEYGVKVYLSRPQEECPVGGGAEINCL